VSPVSSGTDAAAADIFLAVKTKRAGSLKGESTAKGHVDEIVVNGFDFGVSASSAIGSGKATARRQYKHLVVYKNLDAASTSLMSALATNDEVKELKLALRKAAGGQDDFFTITLSGARVVGVDLTCDEHGTTREQASFAFTDITVEYRTQGGTGTAGATSTFTDNWEASS